MGITAWQVVDDAVEAYRKARPTGGQNNNMVMFWDALPKAIKPAVGRRIAELMGREWCGQQVDAFDRFLGFVEVCCDGVKVPFLEKTPAPVLAAAAEAIIPAASRQQAKAAYPQAALIRESSVTGATTGYTLYETPAFAKVIGRGRTSSLAWDDAASKLPAPISGGSPIATAVAGFESWARDQMGLATPPPVSGDPPEAEGPDVALGMIRDGLATLHRAYEKYPTDVTAGLIREFEAALRELERRRTAPALSVPPGRRGGQHAKPTTDPDDLIISILGRDYEVIGLPIPLAIGSHAYRMRGRHHGAAYDLCRDLRGGIQCDCGSATFRDGLCKHVTALVGAGLMPLPASAPLPPFARRWPDAPRDPADGI